MIDYRAGDWGFLVAFGLRGSLAPRALVVAIPNALITFLVAKLLIKDTEDFEDDRSKSSQSAVAASFGVMLFILYNRSRTSYSRWWEGGTLLQKARGEWFNAYSSIMAFTSTKPEMQKQVDEYTHLIARLMSLLMCCGLQQVSPNRDRPFEILGLDGIEPASMDFLNTAPDKVEILLQWIQRSMVLHMQTGVLPVAPPILSRAFQEVSRGIVNLQNARKIADFPYPYPLAQLSMILQFFHWLTFPFLAAMAMPVEWAVPLSFLTIFTLWCIHFNALDLEFPFGTRVNDLPMNEFQQDWNKSLCTLLNKRASRPPVFAYDPAKHESLDVAMSDASELYVPNASNATQLHRMTISRIEIDVKGKTANPHSLKNLRNPFSDSEKKKQDEVDQARKDILAKTQTTASEPRIADAGGDGKPPSVDRGKGTDTKRVVISNGTTENSEGAATPNGSSSSTALPPSSTSESRREPNGREALGQPVGIEPLALDVTAI